MVTDSDTDCVHFVTVKQQCLYCRTAMSFTAIAMSKAFCCSASQRPSQHQFPAACEPLPVGTSSSVRHRRPLATAKLPSLKWDVAHPAISSYEIALRITTLLQDALASIQAILSSFMSYFSST